MKKIPLKNYFILGIILVASVFIVLYINKLYLSTKSNDNIIYKFIKEIKPQEIDNYIIENPNFIIYLGDKESTNKSFEKQFKKLVTKYDLQRDIVFVDIKEFNNESFNEFCKKYATSLLIKDSSLIIIDNQKVIDVLNINEENSDIELVKIFFKKNGVY